MLIFLKLLVVFVGLLGVFGHWAVRWYEKRTTSTFGEYLWNYKAHTFASISANLASSIGICASIELNLTFEQIFTYIVLSYTSGYTWDSKLNKDSGVLMIEEDREGEKDEKNEEDISIEDLNKRLRDDRDEQLYF